MKKALRRVAINGLGRVGMATLFAMMRLTSAHLFESLELVAINAPDWDTSQLLSHIRFDTIHGHIGLDVSYDPDTEEVIIGQKRIKLLRNRSPAELPWRDLEVDYVFECTGAFRSAASCRPHFDAGAKKVIISAPSKGGEVDLTAVFGVTPAGRIKKEYKAVSAASCTTTCASAMLSIFSHFGIKVLRYSLDTIHAYTDDQRLVDGRHKDPSRSRAAACNIIPTATGAAKNVGKVMDSPCEQGVALSIRVPVPNGSLVRLVINPDQPLTLDQLKRMVREYHRLCPRQVGVTEAPDSCSAMFIGRAEAAIVDLRQLSVTPDGLMITLGGWYDNEFGYSTNMLDLAIAMATSEV